MIVGINKMGAPLFNTCIYENKRKHSNIKRKTISKLNKVCIHSEKKERHADNHALSLVPMLFSTIITAVEHHRMYHNGYAPNGT